MATDPCAHVNGLTKPTYVHHRVLGRFRPRKHVHGAALPIKHVDPGIDAGCRRNVVLSRRTTFPALAKTTAPALSVAALSGGPTPPPVNTTPPPAHPVITTPPATVTPPGHPTQIAEPASLFLLLAGLVVLITARRFLGTATPTIA